jgi:hypothetical protein
MRVGVEYEGERGYGGKRWLLAVRQKASYECVQKHCSTHIYIYAHTHTPYVHMYTHTHTDAYT